MGFCEESSPVCSKLVFLGPYMLLGGLLTLIGALVTMEYIGCYDSNFIEGGDTSRIGNINPQTLRFPSKDQKEVDAGDVPDPEYETAELGPMEVKFVIDLMFVLTSVIRMLKTHNQHKRTSTVICLPPKIVTP
ncbi:unnamed protein product [Allacma fusca]|uniref:Uncharacterized protein n=1 Tax=Allacma fusca TaxID=39272 RepID=A0A8J2NXR9_9HEXA|nr:unnamed protein product [Allacma fusca]